MESCIRVLAMLFMLLGVAAVSAPATEGTCSMRVSKIWIHEPCPHWVLNPTCEGLCPDDPYQCQPFTDGFGSGVPGWTQTCRCEDSEGGFAPNPPCSGTVAFDPDLHGPGIGGYYILGCDEEENCGTESDPRQCDQQFYDLEEVPVAPYGERLCECDPS